MALTLLDMARQRKDDFGKAVIETFVQECDISKKLPVATIGTLETVARRTNSIPTVGWRKRGEAPGAVKGGGHDVVTEQVFSMAGAIDIDKADYKDKALTENPVVTRTRETMKGMAWTFNDTFINGDHATEEDGFEGIKVRIANLPSSQTVYAEDSSNDLDIKPGTTVSDATWNQWFSAWDSAEYALDGHKADMILTHADVVQALRRGKRQLGIYKDGIPVEQPHSDGSQRRRTSAMASTAAVESWNGTPVYDVGLKADQTNYIIGTETIGGVATRPVYFLKIGEPYLLGIQQYAMDTSDPFLLDDGVTYRVVVDWPIGLKNTHKFGMSVLKGSAVAA